MVKLTFFGGINEIGGNKIFLEDKDTKLFFDFGFSFSSSRKYFAEFLRPRVCSGLEDYFEFGLLPRMKGVYRDDLLAQSGKELTVKPEIDGVFISHAHADHSWDVAFLHKDMPIYCGETCKLFLQSIQETGRGSFETEFFTYRQCFVSRREKPEFERNFKTFRTGDKIKIGSVEVLPVHVDHCLAPDTLVQLQNGEIRKVSEISTSGKILSFDFKSGKIVNSFYELSKLEATKLLRITTSLNEIKTTPEHKFICLEGLDFVEKKASELKVGDCIIYLSHIPNDGKSQELPNPQIRQLAKVSKEGLKFIRNKRKKLGLTQKDMGNEVSINYKFYGSLEVGKHTCNLKILNKILDRLGINKERFVKRYARIIPDIKIPKRTNPEVCQLLGYLLGNGSWNSKGCIAASDKDEKNLELYQKITEKIFGFIPKIKTRRKGGKLKKLLLPTFVAKFIFTVEPNFFVQSPRRKIPTIIHKLSLKEIAAFLRGLYDAEGSIGHHSIVLTSTSKDLIDVVKLLLLRFGIISWVDETQPLTKNKGYQLVVTHPSSIKRFCREINFGSFEKRQELKLLLKKVGNTVEEKVDLIPIEGKTIMKILKDVQLSTYFLQKYGIPITHFTTDKHTPSRLFLKRFLNLLKKHSEELKYQKELTEKVNYYIKKLETIVFSPFLFLKIKSIRRLSNNNRKWIVYDFYVPGYNNLIANGFLVHNSIPGAYGFIVHCSDSTLVYTGDLRMHGPKRQMTLDFIEKAKEERPDFLIVEGTRMDGSRSLSEEEVRRQVSNFISKTKKLAIANFSWKDVDRLNSFFQACLESRRKLAINTRIAYLLEVLKQDRNLAVPDTRDENVLIYLQRSGWGLIDRNVSKEEKEKDYLTWERKFLDYPNAVCYRDVKRREEEIVLFLDYFDLKELIDLKPSLGSSYIYSTSEPHDEEQEIDFGRMMNWVRHFKLDFKQAHASGHASRKEIVKMIKEIRPRKIIPIHTQNSRIFKKFFTNVLIAKKGVEVKLNKF
ncbi:MAG: LAGLIDADG family homing endonuclease [Candidatus Aenigmatarchaeota archaeon]